jgi:hypothetical protein
MYKAITMLIYLIVSFSDKRLKYNFDKANQIYSIGSKLKINTNTDLFDYCCMVFFSWLFNQIVEDVFYSIKNKSYHIYNYILIN